MRITFVLGSTMLTGGYRTVCECANRLIARGHDVALVHPLAPLHIGPAPARLAARLRGALSNLRRGNRIPWFPVEAHLIRVPTLAPRLLPYFWDSIPDADVVVATAWETAYGVSLLPECKGRKVYFVQHYEAWDVWNDDALWEEAARDAAGSEDRSLVMPGLTPRNPETARIKDLIDATYRLPMAKITTSSWLERLLKRTLGQDCAGKIPIGNNFDSFSLASLSAKPRNRRSLVLSSCRGKKWKGDLDAIEAFKIIRERRPDLDFAMYGQIHDSAIPDWVAFHKAPSDDALRNLYVRSDLFLFASWVEGWGSPPMEAMACGAACVTTDVGGASEYSDGGATALLVPPRNPQALASAALALLSDQPRLRALAGAGHEGIRRFTWDRTVGCLEDILSRALRSEPSSEGAARA